MATMLATKRLAGVTPEVNLREHVTCTLPPSVNKAAHSGLKTQRRHHQKSKTGVSVAPQILKKSLTPVICIVDDIIVVGFKEDHSGHDEAFIKLLHTA